MKEVQELSLKLIADWRQVALKEKAKTTLQTSASSISSKVAEDKAPSDEKSAVKTTEPSLAKASSTLSASTTVSTILSSKDYYFPEALDLWTKDPARDQLRKKFIEILQTPLPGASAGDYDLELKTRAAVIGAQIEETLYRKFNNKF